MTQQIIYKVTTPDYDITEVVVQQDNVEPLLRNAEWYRGYFKEGDADYDDPYGYEYSYHETKLAAYEAALEHVDTQIELLRHKKEMLTAKQ